MIFKRVAFSYFREFPHIADWDDLTCSLNNRKVIMEDGDNSTDLVVPLSSVSPSEFLCSYSTHCFALCMCCDFFACDCRMKCPEGCECFHDQTWSSNIIQCAERGHPEVPDFIPMDATHIYLDGNSIGDLAADSFVGRKHLTELYLNSSRVETLSNKTFNGLTELEVLNLNRNLISELRGGEFGELVSLKELYLGNNRISSVAEETFSELKSIELIDLSGNKLVTLGVWQHLGNGGRPLRALLLSGNPWSCDCQFLKGIRKLISTKGLGLVRDASRVSCPINGTTSGECSSGGGPGDDVMAVSFMTSSDDVSASEDSSDGGGFTASLIPAVAIVCSSLIIVVSLIILAVAFRKPVSLW